ncbi:hypothetical protein GW17_00059527, partial [Ensete ventricosum]
MGGTSGSGSGSRLLEWWSSGRAEVFQLGSAANSCKKVRSGAFIVSVIGHSYLISLLPLLLTIPSYLSTTPVVLAVRRAPAGRGANSSTNPGDLAERANSGTNPRDLAERANSGTNPGDWAERVNSGTNPGDSAERVNSGTNPGNSTEMMHSGINPEDLAERMHSGSNPGDLAERAHTW